MKKFALAIALLVGPVTVFGLVNHHRSNATSPRATSPVATSPNATSPFAMNPVAMNHDAINHDAISHDASGASEIGQQASPQNSKRPVVVELFTSEGCSSCPPADALLARLQDTQPIAGAEIITLSEHVDYWNHLGWRDPYSSAQYTTRQQRYAEASGGEDNYTPEMFVDGQKGFVGSNEPQARAAITAATDAPSATVTLSLEKTTPKPGRPEISLAVRVDNVPEGKGQGPLDVVLAITESGLRSSVKSGENHGRTLLHTSVVRKLQSVGSINPRNSRTFSAQPVVRIDSSWTKDHLRAVVFLQDKSSMRILGAASLDLSGGQ